MRSIKFRNTAEKNSYSNLMDYKKLGLYRTREINTGKLFITPKIDGYGLNDLYPWNIIRPTRPYIDIIKSLNTSSNYKEADYALVPHGWSQIKNDKNYLHYLNQLSHEIPILIFNSGDTASSCSLNNSLELRTHLQPWENLKRKIVFPYPTSPKQFTERIWKSKPTISFMGYVPKFGFTSFFGNEVRCLRKPIKSSVYLIRHISTSRLNNLSKIFDVIVTKRDQFTAYNSNPFLGQHIKEYDELLSETDYVLCPRGLGNSSIRFYETLSSGATPILIDTNSGLPKIPNEKFWETNILKVGLFSNWRSFIQNDWDYLKRGDNYSMRQKQNRETFTRNLEVNQFFNELFKNYIN
jgi:hypothetical protein